MSVEERITDLEMFVSSQEKTIEELSQEVFRLSKLTDSLINQVKQSPSHRSMCMCWPKHIRKAWILQKR